MIEKLLKDINNEIEDSPYQFNDFYVPRVTTILSTMIHDEYLMQWVYRLAMYNRKNYVDERNKAAFIGTMSHKYIEDFLLDKLNLNKLNGLDINKRNKIINCLESFIKWYSDIAPYNIIKIVDIEKKLVCQWYGGTCDLLIEINGKLYLGDFKTSNHIGYKYFLQLAAYKYILELEGYKIDGCIILQLDKDNIAYEEYVLSFDNKIHLDFINLCTECFLSLVYAYYNKLQVEKQFSNIFRR